MLAHNAKTGRSFTVQVKTVRKRDPWPLAHEKVEREHVYVFVRLNRAADAVEYYIVPGHLLKDEPERFGLFNYPKFPGIAPALLAGGEFEDAWEIFNAPVVGG